MPAAGFDPAYIPGLTAPRPAEEDTPKEKAEEPLADAETEAGTEAEAEAEATDARAETADAAEETADADKDDDEDEDGGPVFEASDRRGSISAGRRGVTLRLDGETAEFDWGEIGAVEIDTPRFGRRFSVTVYTTARRWYSADVEASSKRALKEWTTELDAVLDAYFEDAKPEDVKREDVKTEDSKTEDTKTKDAESSDGTSSDTTS